VGERAGGATNRASDLIVLALQPLHLEAGAMERVPTSKHTRCLPLLDTNCRAGSSVANYSWRGRRGLLVDVLLDKPIPKSNDPA